MIEQYEPKEKNALTLMERQIGYEHMFDRKQTKKLIQSKLPELSNKLQLDIISVLVLRTSRTSISALVEMLIEKDNIENSAEEILTSAIELAEHNILLISTDDRGRLYFKCNFSLDTDTLDLIHQYQYKLPLIIEPMKLNKKGNNRGNGYYLNGSDSLILNNYHTKDIDHYVLERFNNIPFSVNMSLLKNIRNSWKHMEKEETVENFERYEKLVYKASSILLTNGNRFYFTHKYDKRGRVYCCGYQLNYQGNSFSKAVLEFANKECISDDINFFN